MILLIIIVEYAQDLNSDLAQYTYKLEFEVLQTRKKLKKQRKNFQGVLKRYSHLLLTR